MPIFFFGFLLVVLNVIIGFGIYDSSLLPRLLALVVFLAVALPVFFSPRIFRKFDVSLLRDPLLILFGVHTLLVPASLFFAINATAGFNDVFKTFGTFLVFLLSCLLLSAAPQWPKLLSRIVTIAALLACGIGYYQLATQCGFKFPTRREAEAITGLMSNVNLYAGFLNLLLPFCLCGNFIHRGFWRAASVLAAVATICLIVLLQSRAAYISLVVGICVVFLAMGVFRKNFGIVISRRAILLLAAAGALMLGGVVALGITIDNPIAQRFRTLFTTDFSSIDGGRLMIWRLTLEMIKDHLLTGVGAGNFTIRMHEYLGRPGQDFSGIITNWAQPHHDFLWVFAEKGLFGFLVFVSIFLLALARGFSALRDPLQRDESWIVLFSLMGLGAYITASWFDFPLERINQQVYLAVFLSVVVVASRREAARRQFFSWALLPLAGLGFAILSMGIAYGISAIRQEYHVNLARRAIRQEKYHLAIAEARLANTAWKTLDPVATPVSFLEGYAAWKMGNTSDALRLLETARIQNPNRLYILLTLAEVKIAAGQNNEALECLNLAAKRYPTDKDVQSLLLRVQPSSP